MYRLCNVMYLVHWNMPCSACYNVIIPWKARVSKYVVPGLPLRPSDIAHVCNVGRRNLPARNEISEKHNIQNNENHFVAARGALKYEF